MLVTTFITACSTEPKFEKAEFEKAYRAAQAVRHAIAANANYQQFGEALKNFSDEVSALKRAVKSKKGRELLNEYCNLLVIYEDGYLLWKYRNEFIRYGFVPKGLIYVGQDVELIAEKYRIPTEKHIYKPTNTVWKSIPENSIQIIWMNTESQLRIIYTILNYER